MNIKTATYRIKIESKILKPFFKPKHKPTFFLLNRAPAAAPSALLGQVRPPPAAAQAHPVAEEEAAAEARASSAAGPPQAVPPSLPGDRRDGSARGHQESVMIWPLEGPLIAVCDTEL